MLRNIALAVLIVGAVTGFVAVAVHTLSRPEPTVASEARNSDARTGELPIPPILRSAVSAPAALGGVDVNARKLVSELEEDDRKLVAALNSNLERFGMLPLDDTATVGAEDLVAIREIRDYHRQALNSTFDAVTSAFRPQIEAKKRLVKECLERGEDPPFDDIAGNAISGDESWNPYTGYRYIYSVQGRTWRIPLEADAHIARLIADEVNARQAWRAAVVEIMLPMFVR